MEKKEKEKYRSLFTCMLLQIYCSWLFMDELVKCLLLTSHWCKCGKRVTKYFFIIRARKKDNKISAKKINGPWKTDLRQIMVIKIVKRNFWKQLRMDLGFFESCHFYQNPRWFLRACQYQINKIRSFSR